MKAKSFGGFSWDTHDIALIKLDRPICKARGLLHKYFDIFYPFNLFYVLCDFFAASKPKTISPL
jgi:hypothetical protein